MKAMRDQFPWLTIPETILSEIETGMPQFLLQEAAGRGKKLMRCTACGCGGIHEPVARNRGMGVCPFCMETVEAVDHTRLRSAPGGEINGLRRGADVMIFRAVDGILWGIDARAWRSIIRNSFDGPDVYTDVELYVHSVYRFEPGCAEQYKWELHYEPETQSGWKWGWGHHATPIEPTNQGYMGMKDGTYAVYGLEDALEQTSCRYCGIDDYFEALGETLGDGSEVRGVIRYLRAWCKRPKLELAVKWGVMDVARDFVDNGRTWGRVVNWKKDTPWEFLKIRKADWKWYRGSRYATVELLDLNRKVFHMPLKDLLAFADSRPGHRWMDKVKKLQEQADKAREAAKTELQKDISAAEAAKAKAEAARADAEARAKALEDKLKTADGDAAAFKVYFSGVQEDLNRMLGMIQKAKPEQKEKYKAALRALLDSVGGAL